jgi:hypothetical protein
MERLGYPQAEIADRLLGAAIDANDPARKAKLRSAAEARVRRHIDRAEEVLKATPAAFRRRVAKDIAFQRSVVDAFGKPVFNRERKGGRGPKRAR